MVQNQHPKGEHPQHIQSIFPPHRLAFHPVNRRTLPIPGTLARPYAYHEWKMTAPLTSLSGLLGLSFASGVNLYAAILVVGLGLRYEWLTGLPKELTPLAHPAVLIAAGLLYTVEFFADKIPFVSAAWDTLHTFIRPIGAAIMALTAASQLGPVEQTLVALAGGASGFVSGARGDD